MSELFKNWTILRGVHLAGSLVVLYYAFMYGHNIYLYILAGGFMFQALTNTGCSNGNCDVKGHRNRYRRR